MDKIENPLLLIDYLDYNFAERNSRDFAVRDAPRLIRPQASKPDRQSWPSEAMLQDVEFVGCITRLTADRMRFDTDIQQKMIGKFGEIRRVIPADQETLGLDNMRELESICTVWLLVAAPRRAMA